MAIQNFLSGGYYGKLGETVGQRWKNKRTIRSYVIPNNPRTEKQQANRGLFANAVTYAQMGLQMNYYATCFESEEFTHWNYRMRVARQLREKGLAGLDLIPLYPISFVPPILISELEVKEIKENKHVTLLCPVLQGEIERVFSVMFDIFNGDGQELGLKLYLGHYSPAEKGILKIDVDDAAEINKYLKVRIVSNDDVNSNTDLIASPTIGIKQQQIEIKDFDTSILSFTKDQTGITIIFNEKWRDDVTTNTISGSVSYVSNGAKVSDIFSADALRNIDGQCALFIPVATSTSQALPAFPNGCGIIITDVQYSGELFQYTKQNAEEPLVDADLQRTLNAPTETGANYGVTLQFDFNYTGVETNIGFGNVLSHYYLGNDIEAEYTFKIKKNSSNKLELFADTQGFMLPMFDGDYISTPAISFVQNGVTYIYSPLIGETFENSIRETTWAENIFDLSQPVIVFWGAEDASDPGNAFIPLNEDLLPNELFEELVTITKSGSYFELNTDSGQDWGAPSSFDSCDLYLTRQEVNEPCYLRFEFYKTYTAEEVIASCILYENAFKFVYNGVTYKSPSVAKSFDNIENNPY